MYLGPTARVRIDVVTFADAPPILGFRQGPCSLSLRLRNSAVTSYHLEWAEELAAAADAYREEMARIWDGQAVTAALDASTPETPDPGPDGPAAAGPVS
jgi:hypothetical protein